MHPSITCGCMHVATVPRAAAASPAIIAWLFKPNLKPLTRVAADHDEAGARPHAHVVDVGISRLNVGEALAAVRLPHLQHCSRGQWTGG